ncbi:hypothetical protein [Streptomyces parvus]|uniref:hypothetical protein n=1 Tax=Streptomyces parvus TaxID=66428 RepID=UPI00344BA4A0
MERKDLPQVIADHDLRQPPGHGHHLRPPLDAQHLRVETTRSLILGNGRRTVRLPQKRDLFLTAQTVPELR